MLLKEFDSTLGYPGEGPTWEEKRRRLLRIAAIDGPVTAPGNITVGAIVQSGLKVEKLYSKKEAKWHELS